MTSPPDAHRARRDRQRRVCADEVDDELRAVAVRRGFDASCDVIVRVPRFVGADGAREVELRVRRVDGDHARRGERAQDLHRHVSETADTDDDRGRARNERSARTRDGVVRSQRGVAERRGLDRIEISEWDEQAVRGHEHVLRHAAVAPEPAARAVELGSRARSSSRPIGDTAGTRHNPTVRRSPTASPGCQRSTPGPNAATWPVVSCPSVNGGVNGIKPAGTSMMCRSEWHAPDAATRTSTSPGPGSGTATSRSAGGRCHSVNWNARMRPACRRL